MKLSFILLLTVTILSCHDIYDLDASVVQSNSIDMNIDSLTKRSSDDRFVVKNGGVKSYLNFDTKALSIILPYHSLWYKGTRFGNYDNTMNYLYGLLGFDVLNSNTITYTQLITAFRSMNSGQIALLDAYLLANGNLDVGFLLHPTNYRWFQQHGSLSVPYVAGAVILTAHVNDDLSVGLYIESPSELSIRFSSELLTLNKYAAFVHDFSITSDDVINYSELIKGIVWYYKNTTPTDLKLFVSETIRAYLISSDLDRLPLSYIRDISASEFLFKLNGTPFKSTKVLRPSNWFNECVAPNLSKSLAIGPDYEPAFMTCYNLNFDYPFDIIMSKSTVTADVKVMTMYVPILSSHFDLAGNHSYVTPSIGALARFQGAFNQSATGNLFVTLGARLELLCIERKSDDPTVVRFFSSYYRSYEGRFFGNFLIPQSFLYAKNSPQILANVSVIHGELFGGFSMEVPYPNYNVYGYTADFAKFSRTLFMAVPDTAFDGTINLFHPYPFSSYDLF